MYNQGIKYSVLSGLKALRNSMMGLSSQHQNNTHYGNCSDTYSLITEDRIYGHFPIKGPLKFEHYL